MRTWICTTLVNFLSPMQGAARLYAYVKKQGYDVSLKDLNQDIYFKLCSAQYLEEAFEKLTSMLFVVSRNKFIRENIGSIVLNSSNNAVRQLTARGMLINKKRFSAIKGSRVMEDFLSAMIKTKIDKGNVIYALLSEQDFIIRQIEKARQVLEKNFLGLPGEEFLTHFKTLLCAKAVIDAVYYPAQLDFGLGFEGTEYRPSATDIINAVSNERHNFLILYYRKEVLPLLERERPGIVGISITHTSEFVPAFTLANMIKHEHPETHICLGGAVATEVAYRIQKNLSLWDSFNSLILGPGEYAFTQLIARLEKKGKLSQVPNLIYKENGSVKKSERLQEFDLNDACTPEYVSLRPKSMLALETSSGCYWGKCMFCYYPKEGLADIDSSGNIRVRKIELVWEDLAKLQEKYEPCYIGITDSSLHPKRIEQIAEFNRRNNKKIRFSAFIRFEKEFKSLAFCEKIASGGFLGGQAGLESGSQRVNEIINKGVDLDDVKIILKNFYHTGILIHIYAIIGVPGETKDDALLTFKFIKRYRRLLTLDWQIYPLRVLEHSPIIARSGEFGLNARALPDEFLAQVMKYEMQKGLSQKESTGLSIRFSERLKRGLNPLHQIMDVEAYKGFLFAQKAKT